MIVPDTAHGTNPASAAMVGYNVISLKSDDKGRVDPADLANVVGPDTAVCMMTNPNTLGLFEARITEISAAVHEAGGLMYYDGANANALMGNARPGDMGFDLMHLNLHKTFSIPHGGGGAGAGPVGVAAHLVEFLPTPVVRAYDADGAESPRRLDVQRRVDLRARLRAAQVDRHDALVLVELRPHGARAGLHLCQRRGRADRGLALGGAQRELHPGRIRDVIDVPYDEINRHEFVASAQSLKRETGVRALDIAKALLDRGYHAPTVYFPLIVPECLMIEPTETESKETLDGFIAAFREIVATAKSDPERCCTRRSTPRSAGSTRPGRRASPTCAGSRRLPRRSRSSGSPARCGPGSGRRRSRRCEFAAELQPQSRRAALSVSGMPVSSEGVVRGRPGIGRGRRGRLRSRILTAVGLVAAERVRALGTAQIVPLELAAEIDQHERARVLRVVELLQRGALGLEVGVARVGEPGVAQRSADAHALFEHREAVAVDKVEHAAFGVARHPRIAEPVAVAPI